MTTRTGYETNAITYGQEMAAKGTLNRFLVWAGETLDRLIADPDAPIFPKDAPLRQGNCGVVAVCMLFDLPYSTVAPAIADAAFGDNKRKKAKWVGGSTTEHRSAAIKALGFDANETKSRKTLGTIANESKGQKGRKMVRVTGHVVVVWDGLIFDQSYPAGATPDEHFSANQIATNITIRA